MLPVKQWPLVFRMGLVASVKTHELWEGTGKDRTQIGLVREVKLIERTKIKELLGKHTDVQAFKERTGGDRGEEPLQALYRQITGIGIAPRAPADAPGLPPPSTFKTIRPKEE